MKNTSLVLNIVLLLAVAFLYYLHFSNRTSSVPVLPLTAFKNSTIVFVNSDSLLEQYTYFKTKKSEFEDKQGKIKSDLKEEGQRLQNEIQEYQQKAAAMSDQQRQQAEEQLTLKQQKFMQKKDDLLGKLDDEQTKSNEELYAKLAAYMKEYNKSKNYSFILGYQKGGGILFANDSLDVTKEIISGLNKAYEKEEKDKK